LSDPTASGLPAIYERELRSRGWRADAAQLAAVARLERLRLEIRAQQGGTGWLARLRRRFGARAGAATVRGIYLWGGVGRGKTWLMDLFFASVGGGARRQHFHQLMRELHAALAATGAREAPIEIVARRMARRAQLWCLDELQVNDIADAMLLGTLFESLLREGVTLVFTSNVPPAGLYRDGLQRARFLPAIALLERELDVLEVDAGTDYRLRQLRQAPVWFDRSDAATPARFAALFTELAGKHGESGRHLLVNGRHINAQRRAGGVVCFSFATLCGGARSADDYAELADAFHTVFVSDIPQLDATQDDATRRLISLVDEFYDRGVKLIASAAAAPAQLYRGERLAFEFRRTASRLVEMQSEAYLARGHEHAPGQSVNSP
jgi:cell division protein ZapE